MRNTARFINKLSNSLKVTDPNLVRETCSSIQIWKLAAAALLRLSKEVG